MITQFEPYYGKEEQKAVAAALASGQLSEGKNVAEFERRFAEFVKAKHCILLPSGATALYIAFLITRGNQRDIFVPDYYGIFAANAATMAGRRVHLADVDKDGTLRSRAYSWQSCCVVHANGRIGYASQIEDCCQAVEHHTKASISCYSFHPTKHITLGGIGGAICCDDDDEAGAIRSIKDHGRMHKGDMHPFVGGNFKVSELNAAFGLAQLDKLSDRLKRLSWMYQLYRELLGEHVLWIEGEPSWQIDVVVPDPEKLVERLSARGIGARRYYRPVHLQEPYFDNLRGSAYPNTNRLYSQAVYLPSTTNLSEEQIKMVCTQVKEALMF